MSHVDPSRALKQAVHDGTIAHMERYSYCTVCDANTRVHVYGNRHFCDEHYTMFYQDLPLIWQASIVTFGMMIGLIVVLAAASFVVSDSGAITLHWAISLGTAVLPTIVWFTLLYRAASRSHTELPALLPVLGAVAVLLAAAAVHPFQTGLLDLDGWLAGTSGVFRLLGTILLKGFPNTFLPYFAVLLITWRTGQFRRRVEGVLFIMAMAAPYASTLAVLYVLDHGTLTLVAGNLRVLSLQASIIASSILLGYFVGQNRFQDMPPYYLSLGVAVCAAINGLLLFASTELDNTSLGITQSGFSPWPGIVVSMLALAGAFALISGLMRRQNSIIQARLENTA
jgi:hypothetical protein